MRLLGGRLEGRNDGAGAELASQGSTNRWNARTRVRFCSKGAKTYRDGKRWHQQLPAVCGTMLHRNGRSSRLLLESQAPIA